MEKTHLLDLGSTLGLVGVHEGLLGLGEALGQDSLGMVRNVGRGKVLGERLERNVGVLALELLKRVRSLSPLVT